MSDQIFTVPSAETAALRPGSRILIVGKSPEVRERFASQILAKTEEPHVVVEVRTLEDLEAFDQDSGDILVVHDMVALIRAHRELERPLLALLESGVTAILTTDDRLDRIAPSIANACDLRYWAWRAGDDEPGVMGFVKVFTPMDAMAADLLENGRSGDDRPFALRNAGGGDLELIEID